MEFLLNLAWGVCSLGLLMLWFRISTPEKGSDQRASRRTQLFALGMVLLLLLPVISLSDDLIATQGPAETDSCLRRATNVDQGHPSVVPAALAMPEQFLMELVLTGVPLGLVDRSHVIIPPSFFSPSLAIRPPPSLV